MRVDNPYHEGELLAQQRLGAVEEGRRMGRAISDSIVRGALKFIEQQSLAVFGSVDDEANVWASVLLGTPGFMKASDERTVELDLPQTARNQHDPFWTNIEPHPQVGLLVIELGSRRRLRINGRIRRAPQERLVLDVAESYPNCPKYIQRRRVTAYGRDGARRPSAPRRGQSLEPDQQALIRSADTFFVASAHPERAVDASHRGGNPGFVKVLDDRRIRVPDYIGNNMFNTLGNFVSNPHAGLVFLDFERARTLQLIGRPEILWNVDDPANETGGTGRHWELEIERWLETDLVRELQWEFLDYSPHNPEMLRTGEAHLAL